MILYSIRSKSTGKYFIHFNGRLDSTWCQTPQFSQKPDTIWRNLKRLCADGYWEAYALPFRPKDKCWKRKNWRNFDARKLKKYEVVTFNVRVLGTKCIDANDFVIPKKLAKMNVRIK